MSKIVKDETRNTFHSFIDNLPIISKKPAKGSASPAPLASQSTVSKKVKRKASLPGHLQPRMAQSVGPSALNTDGSVEDLATQAKTTNVSVTKGT